MLACPVLGMHLHYKLSMEDLEGTLCKCLNIFPVSINIQYLKSLQTNDYLTDVECIKPSEQIRPLCISKTRIWGGHLVDNLINILFANAISFAVLPPTSQNYSHTNNVNAIS